MTKTISKRAKENIVYFLFVVGGVGLFLLFMIYPMLLGFYNSFTDFNGIDEVVNFVGLQNYKDVFTNGEFGKSIFFSAKYTIVTVIGSNCLGLGLALALNRGLKTQGILRSVFFVPMMIGMITVGFLWRFIFSNLVPFLGNLFGIEAMQRNLLSDAGPTFWIICFIAIWQGVGYMMLIYLSGLQKVPKELYEAAAIDGATTWQRFRYVTLPLIRSSMTICVFLTMVNGLKVFDLPYSLTNGGPYGSTQSLAYNIYQEAFTRGNLALATAESFVFCVIVGIVALIQTSVMNRKERE